MAYQTSWLLDADPFLLLLLRGRTADELVTAAGATDDLLHRPVTVAAPERPSPADPPPSRRQPPVLLAPPGMPADAMTRLVQQAAEQAAALLG